MADCLFCKIAGGELTAEIADEDDDLLVIRDINPQGPVHLLVIPRRHIASLDELSAADAALTGRLVLAAARAAAAAGLATDGYRLVINCGRHGCQSVDHLHVHLIGGRQMDWPPG
jgi:histidine triad (HIT) family protein